MKLVKADKGYTGTLESALQQLTGVEVKCVKSNFGTSEFIPVDGRWVVERTFSWLSSYRRMNRNYEKLLSVSCHMAVLACCTTLLKHL
ncbi:MAG: transposase [Clostridium sp.]|nr:transposase [Clostridium sp.]